MPSRTALTAAVRDVLREDRDGDGVPDVLARPRPAPPAPPAVGSNHQPVIFIGVAAALMAVFGVTAFLVMAPAPRRHSTASPSPIVSVSAPPATQTTAAPAVAPSALPAAPATTAAPAPRAAPKLTNEQFGKNVVASRHKKLQECVEQDLLRNPEAPRAYTVTVLVERDGLPLNSATKFVPTPSPGFQTCGQLAIFHAFNNYGRSAPEQVEFTFTTSFAFPNAKPATKASSSWE